MNPSRLKPLALAAAALSLHGAAQAQGAAPATGVQVYGLIDVGVELLNHVGAASAHLLRVPGNTGTLPSRLGFRGTEDLGGGQRAFFVLEAGILPDTGGSGQGGRLFGRQALAGLGGDWGAVSAGRQYSQFYNAMMDSDIMGPALFGLGSIDSYIPNARYDNSVAYRGTFSGVTVASTFSLGRDTVNAGPSPAGANCPGESATDKKACRAYSFMAKYDGATWGVESAYDRLYGRTLTSATDAVFGGLTSSHTTDTRSLLAGYAKVAGARIGAGVIHRVNEGDAVKPRSNFWYLGASAPLTEAFTLDGQFGTMRYASVSGYDSTLWATRLSYALSKRSTLWVMAGYLDNDHLAAVSVSGGATGSNPAAGHSQAGLATGFRHAF